MIRKLRIKFILVSMFSMLLVLSVILGIVNVLNYDEIVHDADSVLALLNAHAGELLQVGVRILRAVVCEEAEAAPALFHGARKSFV